MARKASVTSLGTFIRDRSSLNLTDSKALATAILTHADVEWGSGQEPELPHFSTGQIWRHRDEDAMLRIVDIQIAPSGSTESAVRYWEPILIEWAHLGNPNQTFTVTPEVFVEQCEIMTDNTIAVSAAEAA